MDSDPDLLGGIDFSHDEEPPSASEMVTLSPRLRLQGALQSITSVAAYHTSEGTPCLMTASDFRQEGHTGKTEVWDLAAGTLVATLVKPFGDPHVPNVGLEPYLSSEGKPRVLSTYEDGSALVWDGDTFEMIVVIGDDNRAGPQSYVYEEPTGGHARFALGYSIGMLDVYDGDSCRKAQSLRLRDNAITCLSGYEKDGSVRLVAGCYRGVLAILDPEAGTILRSFACHISIVKALACFEAGEESSGEWRVAAMTHKGGVEVWDPETAEQKWAREKGGRPWGGFTAYRDPIHGRYRLARGAAWGTSILHADLGVTVQNLRHESAGDVLLPYVSTTTAAARLALVAGRALRVWDPEAGRELVDLRGHSVGVWRLQAFVAEGGRGALVSTDSTGAILTWEVDDMLPPPPPPGGRAASAGVLRVANKRG
jgi:WD40 repeat protein